MQRVQGLPECAGEVIRGDLIRWDKSFVDEVLCPPIKNTIVLRQVGSIARSLSVGEGHQNHIAAFFKRHFFGITIWMTCERGQFFGSLLNRAWV